jgi:hypothetical protein
LMFNTQRKSLIQKPEQVQQHHINTEMREERDNHIGQPLENVWRAG